MLKSLERKQSAAIAYRRSDDGQVEVLLVSSRKRQRWILPKGKVPRGMPAHAFAAREVREEGGVIGTVHHARLVSIGGSRRPATLWEDRPPCPSTP